MSPSETLKILGRPVAYHPRLARLFGSVNAAILFGQLVYWSDTVDHELGIHKTAAQIEEETGLSPKEQDTARKKLKNLGVLHETYKRAVHRLYFKVDFDAYDKLVLDFLTTAKAENTKPQSNESLICDEGNSETQKGDSRKAKGRFAKSKKGIREKQKGDSSKEVSLNLDNLDNNINNINNNINNIYTRTRHPETKKMGVWEQSVKLLVENGVEEQIAVDFIAVRKSKRAALTQTAFKKLLREAAKANLTLNQVCQLCAEKNWQGFEAAWLVNTQNTQYRPSVKDVPHHTEGGRLSW